MSFCQALHHTHSSHLASRSLYHRPSHDLSAPPTAPRPFIITSIMATDGPPRLRLVSLAEVDDLAKLNEPVEPLARDQAMEIINDIKVRLIEWMVALPARLHTTGKCAQPAWTHTQCTSGWTILLLCWRPTSQVVRRRWV